MRIPTGRARRAVTRGVVAVVIATAAGCKGCHKDQKPPAPPPPPVHRLCLEASPRLNWYGDAAHTLYVRIFQLSSTEAFQQVDAGRLLDQQLVLQGAEGTSMDRQVYPGTTTTVEITQKPNAQAFGLVGGYYRAEGLVKVSRPFPVVEPKDEDDEEEEDEDEPKAPPPCVKILLGPNGIEVP